MRHSDRSHINWHIRDFKWPTFCHSQYIYFTLISHFIQFKFMNSTTGVYVHTKWLSSLEFPLKHKTWLISLVSWLNIWAVDVWKKGKKWFSVPLKIYVVQIFIDGERKLFFCWSTKKKTFFFAMLLFFIVICVELTVVAFIFLFFYFFVSGTHIKIRLLYFDW